MKLTKEEALDKIEELKEYVKSIGKRFSLGEELHQHPEKFERLTSEGWEDTTNSSGVTQGNVEILNSAWNNSSMNGKVYYLKFDNEYLEIIRRK